jgi:hypothetical protein
MKKVSSQKGLKTKSFLAAQAALSSQGFCFWGITLGLKIAFEFKIVFPLDTCIMYLYKKSKKIPVQIALYGTYPKIQKKPQKLISSFRD